MRLLFNGIVHVILCVCVWMCVCAHMFVCMRVIMCMHVFAMLCMKMFVIFVLYACIPLICITMGICALYVFL